MPTALITGGAGFIGSWLAEHLLEAGWAVRVLDDLSTGRSSNLAGLSAHPRFTFLEGDAADAARVEASLERADAVVHLAAAVGVQLVAEAPVQTLKTNVRATEVVLDAAAARGCPALLASSSEVYGRSRALPFAEDAELVVGPPGQLRWSYACSKLLDEFYAMALHRERGAAVTVVRLFNTVGPRQRGRYGMVLPRFVSQALRGDPITVYGDGQQTRCFCHVADVVRALEALLEAPRPGEVINLGGTEEVSILGLAGVVKERAASPSAIVTAPYPAGLDDMRRRVPSIAKAGRELGWSPRWTLAQTVDDVIASFRRASAEDQEG